MNKKEIKKATIKTVIGFKQMLPIMFNVIMLISLSLTLIPNSFYKTVFTGNKILDPLIGGSIGSIATGNPVTSYMISGELIKQNIGLTAITAFILTWVTVGIVQLPAESLMLGKKFAITRNIISFLMAIIAAFLITLTLAAI